jgi:mannosyl-oligosaccharide alpha-1,2-mannosidase
MLRPSIQRHQKSPRLSLERILPLTFPLVLIIVVLFLFLVLPGNTNNRPPVAPPDSTLDVNVYRRREIEAAFDFAWDGYYKFAFPHDEMKPLTNGPGYSRNDWGATAVDALGTAILMEKSEIVKIILAHIEGINFNHTETPISVFESTIRYMGGLLSAYELLNGPFSSLNLGLPNVTVLLNQATNLGKVLSTAFIDGNALPSGVLDPKSQEGNGKNSLAGAGTLVSCIY